MKKNLVSIIIPAYNEANRIEVGLSKLSRYLDQFELKSGKYQFEILIWIEKSSDKTAEIARGAVSGDSRFQVIESDVQKGKGFAIKSGLLKSRGEICFFMDVDMATGLEAIGQFLSHFESHPEKQILIGDRKNHKAQVVKKQNWIRQRLGELFNQIVQFFVYKGIRDTQCGFKAFRRETISPLFLRQTRNGFSFDVEILILTKQIGFEIESLPVVWANVDGSKVRLFRDGFAMLLDILLLKFKFFLEPRTLLSRSISLKTPGLTSLNARQ